MDKIEMVVFDMAGTTVKDENEVEMCFVKAAEQTQLLYERDDIIAMMGWSKKKVFETLWAKALPEAPNKKVQGKVAESYEMFKQILEDHYRTATVCPSENCIETFETLRNKGIKIALTTGFYREVTNIILNRLGWDKNLNSEYVGYGDSIIDISIASDEVEAGRPAPFMIQKAMKLMNISNPSNVINIGDTPSDLLSGYKANCKYSLGVCNGTHTREQLAELPNDGLLADIGEIKNFIS